jgi:hypothetical protein
MKTVAFCAPFLRPNTVRFLRAMAALPDIRLGLISHDSPLGLDPWLRDRIVAHAPMRPSIDAGAVLDGTQALIEQMGPLDRLVGMLEQLQVSLARVRDALDIEGMRTEAILNFRDKSRMKEVLTAAGLPCARHRLVERPVDALDFAREVGFPLVVKPVAGAGSVATFRVADLDELVAALEAVKPSASRQFVVEEFVQGRERSLEVLSNGGEPVWHSICLYDPTPLEVLRTPWVQWTVLLPREVEQPQFDIVREAGFAALKALGMDTGMSHMEWFRRPDGSIAINEIAARPPGANIMSLMSWSTDRDLWSAWAELVVHGTCTPPTRQWATGVAFLRGQGRQGGRVARVRGLSEAQAKMGALVVEAELPRIGAVQRPGYEGEGFAIVRAKTTEEVRGALGTLIGTVRVDLE